MFAPRKQAATRGADGAMVMNAAIDAIFAPKSDELIRCLPGKANGLELMRPDSFKNATMEPVNVMPPTIMMRSQSAKL